MKAIPLPKMKLIRFSWVDSNYAKGWHNENHFTASIPSIVTVGYVTHSDKDMLEVSNTIGLEGAKLNALSVPWASIKEVKVFGSRQQ